MNTRTAVHTDKESPFAPNPFTTSLGDSGKNDAISRGMSSALLQHLTERLRGLPRLFVADVGVAHRGADILVAEELLDLPQILSHLVEEDRGSGATHAR